MDRAIHVLNFDGKTSNWPMWEGKYASRGRAKGWYAVMSGAQQVPDASAILDDTAVKAKAARKANEEGYADMILSMEDAVCFNVVNEARTTHLPDGILAKAWTDLKAKYAPTTKSDLVSLKQEFMMIKMDTGDDPEEYLTELESVNRKIRTIDAARAVPEEEC